MKSEINQSTLVRALTPVQDCWHVVMYRMGIRKCVHDLTIRQLEAEGFEFYRPMTQRQMRPMINGVRATTLQMVSEPLFGNYMFVRRVRPGRAELMSIFGIERGFMVAVRQAVIDRLRAEEVDGYIRFVNANDPSRDQIKEGDEVETLDGLIQGVVTCNHLNGRLSLLSRFMGGSSHLLVSLARVVRTRTAEQIASASAIEKATKKKKGRAPDAA
ncbi:MAG: hypothetical protein NVV72_01140 [Asticcacaulis sp.]|nr:hypothetical protein [Asticcacaulis sp.]